MAPSVSKQSAQQILGRRRIKRKSAQPTRAHRQTSRGRTKPSQAQTVLAKHAKRVLKGNPSYRQEQTWTWLKTKAGYNMYVDILFEDLKLAIEYNGPHHYLISKYAQTKKKLRDIQSRDELKESLLKKHGYTVIQWPYTRSISLRSVWKQLHDAGFEVEAPPKKGRLRVLRRVRRLV